MRHFMMSQVVSTLVVVTFNAHCFCVFLPELNNESLVTVVFGSLVMYRPADSEPCTLPLLAE